MRELESFSPEVLAEFIRDNVPMLSTARASKVLADLIHIEARQRIEKINLEACQVAEKTLRYLKMADGGAYQVIAAAIAKATNED